MRTLIIFDSKHGATKKIALSIASKMKTSEVFNVSNIDRQFDFSKYSFIIIGGPIYEGKIRKRLLKFILKNKKEILSKRFALFISEIFKGEIAEEEFKNSFPKEFLKKSIANGILGGEIIFSKLNFFEKILCKFILKQKEDKREINNEAIERFIEKIKSF